MRNLGLINNVKGLYLLQQGTSANSFCGAITCQTWHNRLGHVSLGKLKHVLSTVSPNLNKFNFHCSACHFAKQSKTSFPHIATKTLNCFDLIHMDVWREIFTFSLFMGKNIFLH